jgi:hypothetical protein
VLEVDSLRKETMKAQRECVAAKEELQRLRVAHSNELFNMRATHAQQLDQLSM